jgi:hypothetical protein
MDNIITVLIGILLTISEILPYIKQIESNGILEFLTNNIIEMYRNKLNSLHIQDNLQESQPFLENDTYNDTNYLNDNVNENFNPSSNLNDNVKKVNSGVNININSENVLLKFNTSNVKILLDVDEKNSEIEVSDNLYNSELSKNSEVN